MPLVLLKGKTPYEVFFGKKPDYTNLKVFGYLCYVSTLKRNRHKFMPRAERSVFIGYSNTQKGYKVYNLENKTISVSKDVIFYEHHFLYHQNNANKINHLFMSTSSEQPIRNEKSCTNDKETISESEPIINHDYDNDFTNITHSPDTQTSEEAIVDITEQETSPTLLQTHDLSPQEVETLPRRSQRTAKTPTHLQDYYCHNVCSHWCGFVTYKCNTPIIL